MKEVFPFPPHPLTLFKNFKKVKGKYLCVILSGGNVPHRIVAFCAVQTVTPMVKTVRHPERGKKF